jgi:hypothetical protein
MLLGIRLPRGSWYVRLNGSRRRGYSIKFFKTPRNGSALKVLQPSGADPIKEGTISAEPRRCESLHATTPAKTAVEAILKRPVTNLFGIYVKPQQQGHYQHTDYTQPQ